jgi:hypothetical protein
MAGEATQASMHGEPTLIIAQCSAGHRKRDADIVARWKGSVVSWGMRTWPRTWEAGQAWDRGAEGSGPTCALTVEGGAQSRCDYGARGRQHPLVTCKQLVQRRRRA